MDEYIPRPEFELFCRSINGSLARIEADITEMGDKIDAILACLSEHITRQEYDHRREICSEDIRRVQDKIDEVAHHRVDRATMALISILSSLLVGVAVALVTLVVQRGGF